MRPATSVVPPIRHGWSTRCSWAKPRTSATPGRRRKWLTAAACRSPKLADFPIRGYEFYDYHHELDNVTFVNFQDNATRKTGAISYLLYTSFGMSSNNTIERAKFINAEAGVFPTDGA